MPGFFNNFPRVGLIAVVPVVVFLIAAAASFGMGGGDDDNTANSQPTATATQPASAAAATPTLAAATPTAAAVATPTAEPNRADCNAIRGTDYRSATERTWFNQNCTGTASASTGASGSTSSSGSSGSSGSSAPSGGSGGTGSGPVIAAGAEYALGDRLIIPAAGVNAPVSGVKVGSSGVMPDPVGYDNAVWYDFSALGLGGYVNGGNLVLAGHVDCGRCRGGGPGQAVFYNTRYLSVGATIQYVTSSGATQNYVVFSNVDYSANADFSAVVSPGAADLTLITCTGAFSGGHYDLRNVVFARKV